MIDCKPQAFHHCSLSGLLCHEHLEKHACYQGCHSKRKYKSGFRHQTQLIEHPAQRLIHIFRYIRYLRRMEYFTVFQSLFLPGNPLLQVDIHRKPYHLFHFHRKNSFRCFSPVGDVLIDTGYSHLAFLASRNQNQTVSRFLLILFCIHG